MYEVMNSYGHMVQTLNSLTGCRICPCGSFIFEGGGEVEKAMIDSDGDSVEVDVDICPFTATPLR